MIACFTSNDISFLPFSSVQTILDWILTFRYFILFQFLSISLYHSLLRLSFFVWKCTLTFSFLVFHLSFCFSHTFFLTSISLSVCLLLLVSYFVFISSINFVYLCFFLCRLFSICPSFLFPHISSSKENTKDWKQKI